jgi:hypothetical protein
VSSANNRRTAVLHHRARAYLVVNANTMLYGNLLTRAGRGVGALLDGLRRRSAKRLGEDGDLVVGEAEAFLGDKLGEEPGVG